MGVGWSALLLGPGAADEESEAEGAAHLLRAGGRRACEWSARESCRKRAARGSCGERAARRVRASSALGIRAGASAESRADNKAATVNKKRAGGCGECASPQRKSAGARTKLACGAQIADQSKRQVHGVQSADAQQTAAAAAAAAKTTTETRRQQHRQHSADHKAQRAAERRSAERAKQTLAPRASAPPESAPASREPDGRHTARRPRAREARVDPSSGAVAAHGEHAAKSCDFQSEPATLEPAATTRDQKQQDTDSGADAKTKTQVPSAQQAGSRRARAEHSDRRQLAADQSADAAPDGGSHLSARMSIPASCGRAAAERAADSQPGKANRQRGWVQQRQSANDAGAQTMNQCSSAKLGDAQRRQPTVSQKKRRRPAKSQATGAEQQPSRRAARNQRRSQRSLSGSSSLGSSSAASSYSASAAPAGGCSLLQLLSRLQLQNRQPQALYAPDNRWPGKSEDCTSSCSDSCADELTSSASGGEEQPRPAHAAGAKLPALKQQLTRRRSLAAPAQPPRASCSPLDWTYALKPETRPPDAGQLARFPKPPPRPWLSTGAGREARGSFTVMSYNVLSDRMVSTERFPRSPGVALDWSYRRAAILKQLVESHADVIALQELELEQFELYFRPELAARANYEGLFEPKSRARTMDEQMRRRVDGCAIFYRRDRFKLIQSHLLEFNQIAMANAHGSEAMLNRVMTKDNIGLAAVLELRAGADEDEAADRGAASQITPLTIDTGNNDISSLGGDDPANKAASAAALGRRVLVCNTHIHWDPEHCDVKLIQTIMLMNELKCIARHHVREQRQQVAAAAAASEQIGADKSQLRDHNNNSGDAPSDGEDLLPLVLLGDFNSLPKSGVSSYLLEGKIDSLHKDFKEFKYTSCSNSLAISASGGAQLADLGGSSLRRQSSPAWCFYSPTSAANDQQAPSSPSASSNASSAYFSGGARTPSLPDSARIPTPPPVQAADPVHAYRHPFELVSAYERDSMPYTNFTTKFKATIDYIYYSSDSLRLLGRLGPLDARWLKSRRIKGLPQPHLPSDHLPLLVRLELRAPDELGARRPLASGSPARPKPARWHRQARVASDSGDQIKRDLANAASRFP